MENKKRKHDNVPHSEDVNKATRNDSCELLDALKDTKLWSSRRDLIRLIGSNKNADEQIIKGLVMHLKDKKPAVRVSVAEALGELSHHSEDLITTILLQLLESYDGTPHSIGFSFEKVTCQRNKDFVDHWLKIISTVSSLLRSSAQPNIRRCCIEVLGGIMTAITMRASIKHHYLIESKITPIVIDYTNDDDELVRMSAADVLGRVTGDKMDAISALVKMLEKNDTCSVQLKIVSSVGKIGMPLSDRVRELLENVTPNHKNLKTLANKILNQKYIVVS
ncbi:ribosome-releasing factor 2, mitochondrial [Acrasis kona]|uniref:Ribosome-releasing factor 2, mitochondrial n=1 Tax=Acrasis kona TaxID=1008807 RepID=A0AAW2Z1W4_9EUKA